MASFGIIFHLSTQSRERRIQIHHNHNSPRLGTGYMYNQQQFVTILFYVSSNSHRCKQMHNSPKQKPLLTFPHTGLYTEYHCLMIQQFTTCNDHTKLGFTSTRHSPISKVLFLTKEDSQSQFISLGHYNYSTVFTPTRQKEGLPFSFLLLLTFIISTHMQICIEQYDGIYFYTGKLVIDSQISLGITRGPCQLFSSLFRFT